MKWDLSNKQARWNLICALILVLGLGSALVVYIAAPDAPDNLSGYEVIGGRVYPTVPSKMYTRNLELYGGQWAVLADDLTRWYNSLWEGKSLSVTIACLAVIIAGVIFFFNNHVSFEDETS